MTGVFGAAWETAPSLLGKFRDTVLHVRHEFGKPDQPVAICIGGRVPQRIENSSGEEKKSRGKEKKLRRFLTSVRWPIFFTSQLSGRAGCSRWWAKRLTLQSTRLTSLHLISQATETDTILLFIAGHGFNDGPNYRFLATNAERLGDTFRGTTKCPGMPCRRPWRRPKAGASCS